jgi:ribosomal 30S subunit maturation factor RimM
MTVSPRKPGGDTSPYLEVGHFGKSHSLHGECRFFSKPGAEQNLATGLTGYLRSSRGEFVPHRIEKLTLQKSASASKGAMFFLKLDRIQSRDQADTLRDQSLWVDATDEWSLALDHDGQRESLAGLKVYNEGAFFGHVLRQDETPAHPVVLIEHISGEEITVPFIEEFLRFESSESLLGINLDMFLEDAL